MADRPPDKEQVIQDFASYVSPSKVAAYRALGFDIVPGRREGVRVWDLDEKRSWIDCRTAGGVFNLGHRPPRIIAALHQALDYLDIGDHILLSQYRAALAKRLAELTPGDITYTVFGVGGGEAADVAIKLARGYSGKAGIICAVGAYHGHTGLALAATDGFSGKFGPLAPGFKRVPFGNIEALAQAIDDDTAAVIVETIPATAGMLIPPPDYFPRVRQLCDEAGVLLVIDEVQAGLGRTGRLWAIDEYQVVPDIMFLGKGMSAAIYPISATCYRPQLQSFFDADPFIHISTYGGSDLGCVTCLAMLDQITEPGFLTHVQQMGERFAEGLAALKRKHPKLVTEVRQRGLMIGVDMANDICGPLMVRAMGQRGVISIYAHLRPSTLQLMPPLIIKPGEVDEVLDALDLSLGEVAQSLGLA
ncbi:MAG: aspartate aminotransferase family protein [Dehalococcoidia bacterium]